MNINLNVNGTPVAADIDPATLLSEFLRDELDLTGTHVACDTSQCGACVVHVDGESVKSCTVLAAALDGAEVTTIEGVADPTTGELHPMQRAFHEHHGLQCGFCTPGMVMNAVDFAKRHPNASEQDVREALDGNLCRCTGYHNIVKSIMAGSRAMAAAK